MKAGGCFSQVTRSHDVASAGLGLKGLRVYGLSVVQIREMRVRTVERQCWLQHRRTQDEGELLLDWLGHTSTH